MSMLVVRSGGTGQAADVAAAKQHKLPTLIMLSAKCQLSCKGKELSYCVFTSRYTNVHS